MDIFRLVVATILFFTGVAAYQHAKYAAPDPYAVCAARETPLLHAQCRDIVSFALSAGW